MAQIHEQRQIIYWRLLATLFEADKDAASIDKMAAVIAKQQGLPRALLNPRMSVNELIERYPDELGEAFDHCIPAEADNGDEVSAESIRSGLIFSKLLLNAFGPNTQTQQVTAAQLSQWSSDVGHLERAFGYAPGELRSGKGGGLADVSDHGPMREALGDIEKELVNRMKLHEVLNDDSLTAQITPSMALTEQLLREKGHLSGKALANAKKLIQSFIGDLAEVLRLQVEQTSVGEIDRSVPPKPVFRNLDLQRTIWKNLTNWNPDEERLYVDRLYYKQRARKTLPTRMIVVVDQSGSMVNSMVQCAIIASIFAGLPNVDMHLIAFDTRAIDLTAWAHDPFEVLMRTDLGGGNNGVVAMDMANEKIVEPRRTALVWVSDFYEVHALFPMMKAAHESGVKLLPVGSVSSTGYYSLNPWYRDRFKQLGTPVLNGSPKKLIVELKKLL